MYFVNGYKFHTAEVALNKSTNNSGVCIKGTDYAQAEYDFYGILHEIVELEYTGVPVKRVVLFKCEWFDPTPNRGTKIHPHYGTVEVHASRRYNKYDPFILAQQAMQVYYMPYPCCRQKENWLAVIKIKARSVIDTPASEANVGPFQVDDLEVILPIIVDDDDEIPRPIIDTLATEVRYEDVDMPVANMEYEENEDEEEDDDDEEEDTDDEVEDVYVDEDEHAEEDEDEEEEEDDDEEEEDDDEEED